MSSTRYVVQARRPLRTALGLLVLLAVIAAAGSMFHQRTVGEAEARIAALDERVAGLEAERARLAAELTRVREEGAVVARGRQVEEEAYARVDDHLRDLQGEVLRLRREVAFYRDIVGARARSGVNVQTFMLAPAGPQRWRYELVLTRGRNDGKVIAGMVRLAVDGTLDGSERTISFPAKDGSAAATPDLGFEFRYFQRLDGQLTLPDGFVPQSVRVRASVAGRAGESDERRFEWPIEAG